MKTLKEAFKDEPNETDASELFYYITSSGDLYRKFTLPFQKNLLKRIQKGKYDSEKAVKLWMYLTDAAAKEYKKEMLHPGDDTKWYELFNKATRNAVAERLAEKFEAEVKSGAFDEISHRSDEKK